MTLHLPFESWVTSPISSTNCVPNSRPNSTELARNFGEGIQGYSPQAWAFKTETETVTLNVNTEGNVSLGIGGAPNPDVLVNGTFDALSAALSIRNPAMVPADAIQARPLKSKGNSSFRFKRHRLG